MHRKPLEYLEGFLNRLPIRGNDNQQQPIFQTANTNAAFQPPRTQNKMMSGSTTIFQSMGNEAPIVPSRPNHPVSKSAIRSRQLPVSDTNASPLGAAPNEPLYTNNFYSNLFLGDQVNGVWVQPYSICWSKGRGNAASWGMAINHFDNNEIAYGPPNDRGVTRYFFGPIGKSYPHHTTVVLTHVRHTTNRTVYNRTRSNDNNDGGQLEIVQCKRKLFYCSQCCSDNVCSMRPRHGLCHCNLPWLYAMCAVVCVLPFLFLCWLHQQRLYGEVQSHVGEWPNMDHISYRHAHYWLDSAGTTSTSVKLPHPGRSRFPWLHSGRQTYGKQP